MAKSDLIIPGYKITDIIYSDQSSHFYNGVRNHDNKQVIIKLDNKETFSSQDSFNVQQEFDLVCTLSSDYIVKYLTVEDYHNGYAIIAEGGNITPFSKMIPSNGLAIGDFLNFAIQLTKGLQFIHNHSILYKNVCPDNIVFDNDSGNIRYLNFHLANYSSIEMISEMNFPSLVKILTYSSPELTGRMNQSVDYRSDLYSLGITFYQMITGKLPFYSNDFLELIYLHIAKDPINPSEISKKIPGILSQIILKLLAKDVRERYQSTSGLLWDLEQCLTLYRKNNKISSFKLYQMDVSDKFQISKKLVGRSEEVATLLASYEKSVTAEPLLFLVTGPSGIGKSTLVNEIKKPLATKKGFWIAGKYEKLKKNVAYSAISQAFASLIEQFLKENEQKFNYWKQEILQALQPSAQVLIDFIPELQLLIGEQPSAPDLGATENQNRFNHLFLNFLDVLCKDQPVTIFLDDIQWMDPASLKLLRQIMHNPPLNLFVIGAYRDNEVSLSDPLAIALDEMRKESCSITTLKLCPLQESHLQEIVAETLNKDLNEVTELAQICYSKTLGNAFFFHEYLKILHEQHFFWFDKSNGWQWDLQKINSNYFADNVIDLMIAKVSNMSQATQEILKTAACLGNSFTILQLTAISKKNPQDLLILLNPALDSRLIYATQAKFYFIHDRVHEAVYSLLDQQQKIFRHNNIGYHLLNRLEESDQQHMLFEIVGQLNKGAELIVTLDKKMQLARLNLAASQRAKKATAIEEALQYIRCAVQLTDASVWYHDYAFAISTYREYAELEYLTGNYDKSEQIIALFLQNAQSNLEKAEILNTLIQLQTLTAKYQEAIENGYRALLFLDITLPKDICNDITQEAFQQVANLIKSLDISGLLDKEQNREERIKIAIRVLANMGPLSYFARPKLLPIVVLKIVEFAVEYGNSPEAIYGYSVYGLLLGSFFQQYQLGYQFGMLGLKLSDKYNSVKHKSIACVLLGDCTNSWAKHIKNSSRFFEEGYSAGLHAGEMQFAGYALMHQPYYCFYSGQNLEAIYNKIPQLLPFLRRTQNQVALDIVNGMRIMLQGLLQRKCDEEKNYLESCHCNNSYNALFRYYTLKQQFCYLSENYSSSLEFAQKAKGLKEHAIGAISQAESNFYYSLALIQQVTIQPERYRDKIACNQEKLVLWANNCPENFAHKKLLVLAELARIEQQPNAPELFQQAIASAKQYGFVQNEALANELAGKYWLQRGIANIANMYLQEAIQLYNQWGAKYKVNLMLQQYNLMSSAPLPFRKTDFFDFQTIMKSSQAISKEMDLDNLLTKIVQIIVECSGAQKAFLLLPENEELQIRVQMLSPEKVEVTSYSLEESTLLSQKIVNYVRRVKRPEVLYDATTNQVFRDCDYIGRMQPKSILCTPILNKGNITAILYLENNLTRSAFSEYRVKILNLLLGQATISVENAKLYQDSNQRKKQLEDRNAELEKFNYIVSHDLKTPLVTILSFIDVLKLDLRDNRVERLERNLEFIQNAANKMFALIESILEFSKIGYNKHLDNVCLSELTQEVVTSLQYIFASKQVQVQVSDNLPMVRGNQTQLFQVFQNLLENAVKFMGQQPKPTITIDYQVVSQKTVISVTDNGIGIELEYQNKVFDLFERLNQNIDGTGIGLGVVKRIIEAHGGEVWVDSDGEGKGSSFCFTLPTVSS